MLNPIANPIAPETIGFTPVPGDDLAWTRTLRGTPVTFRILRTLEELLPGDDLQARVMGVNDYDLLPAGEMICIQETGGDVIGALVDGQLVGISVGWGGYFERRPRIVSDFLAIDRSARSLGVGTALKHLQAALAVERGFEEIIWTVDPLRAPNARLNFEKLGAWSEHYEIDRYGSAYGEGLYGGLPTDRFHVTWAVTDPAVQQGIREGRTPRAAGALDHLPRFSDSRIGEPQLTVAIPADIDALLARDREAALDWRYRLRGDLMAALAAGYRASGFAVAGEPESDTANLLIERTGEGHGS